MSRPQAITAAAAILLLCACTPAAAHDAAAHTATGGTVTGKLQIEGGPLGPGGQQPGKRPVPGTLVFTSTHHHRVTVRVGSAGRFSVQLPAGTYAVCPRPPATQRPCSDGRTVTVTAQHTTKIVFTFRVP